MQTRCLHAHRTQPAPPLAPVNVPCQTDALAHSHAHTHTPSPPPPPPSHMYTSLSTSEKEANVSGQTCLLRSSIMSLARLSAVSLMSPCSESILGQSRTNRWGVSEPQHMPDEHALISCSAQHTPFCALSFSFVPFLPLIPPLPPSSAFCSHASHPLRVSASSSAVLSLLVRSAIRFVASSSRPPSNDFSSARAAFAKFSSSCSSSRPPFCG